MTATEAEAFFAKLPGFYDLSPAEQTVGLLYYLSEVVGLPDVSCDPIDTLRTELRLAPFKRTAQHLSEKTKAPRGKNPLFVKLRHGYGLHRAERDDIARSLADHPAFAEVAQGLRDLAVQLKDEQQKDYALEAVGCFESQFYRASIVMAWALAYAVFRQHLFDHHRAALNTQIATWKKPKPINDLDDFQEHAESVVIQTAREAKILKKEEHKTLAALLETRNSYAHPSGRAVTKAIAQSFLETVLHEVLKRYQ